MVVQKLNYLFLLSMKKIPKYNQVKRQPKSLPPKNVGERLSKKSESS